MRRSRFTEPQTVTILKPADNGIPLKDLIRKHGVSMATYYQWKSRYGGMEVAELARVRDLEQENAKRKWMYANLALENAAIEGLIAKKQAGPLRRREAAKALVVEQGLSVRRACRVARLPRRSWYRIPTTDHLASDAEVIDVLQGIVARHGRWGFWKCFKTVAAGWISVEPQAGVAGVLSMGPEFAAANEKTVAWAGAIFSGGSGARQCAVVDGLHGRLALLRPTVPDLEHA